MKGRKPKPSALREFEGNPGNRPINDDEPKPDPSMPEMPKGLTGDARKCWESLAPELNELGILTKLDVGGLESYCRLYAVARECWRKVKQTGGPVVMVAGKAERNPYIAEAHRAEQLLHKIRSELGLNATSRTRIAVKPSESEDDVLSLLSLDQGQAA